MCITRVDFRCTMETMADEATNNTAAPPSGGFMDPSVVVSDFEVADGMQVADFGVGPGFFAVLMAQRVGDTGRVTGIDIQQSKLENLQVKANIQLLTNIDFIQANLEQPGGAGLQDESQDFVLLANILYESRQKADILREAKRILKPGGRIAVIDWHKGIGGLGPPNELRTDVATMQAILTDAGFQFYKNIPVDSFHYGFVYRKP